MATLYNHDAKHIHDMLVKGSREELIGWLCWNDRNGIYSDADSDAEGLARLDLKQAILLVLLQVNHSDDLDRYLAIAGQIILERIHAGERAD